MANLFKTASKAACCNFMCSTTVCMCGNREVQYRNDSPGPKPANHLHDICHDMDYRADGGDALFGRNQHSPLRHPSPPAPCYCCPPSENRRCRNQHQEASVREQPLRYQSSLSNNVCAVDVTNPESISIVDQCTSNPLRNRSNSPLDHSFSQQARAVAGSSAFDNGADKSIERESAQLKREIVLLNHRLDQIDQHCRDFTKLAQEKSVMEENLKNLAYMQQMQAHHEAQQKVEADNSKVSEHVQQPELSNNYNEDNETETRARRFFNEEASTSKPSPVLAPQILTSKEAEEAASFNNRRDVSRDEKETQAKQKYDQDLEKLDRIMNTRKESLERVKSDENLDLVDEQNNAFNDEAYLAILNQDTADENRIRPLADKITTNSRRPNFDTYNENERQSNRVQFSDQVRGGIPHYQPDQGHNKQGSSSPDAQGYRNDYLASEHKGSVYTEQVNSASSRVQNDFSRRSPSPIREMNYFEGIQAIREEQNQFYQSLLDQQMSQHAVTSQMVQRTRQSLAQEIQSKYYDPQPKSRGSKQKASLKSRQHDEFAILNYFAKVSKYDLDRANLCMRDAWRVKQGRRVENAKAKREMINGQVAKERHQEASTKVKRIRDLSVVKESQKQERRDNAIRHQEMLKSFLDQEKSTRKDERPLQYVEEKDISAFGANTSMFGEQSMRAGSRSASRSPAPATKMWSQSAKSNSKTRPRISGTAYRQRESVPLAHNQQRGRAQNSRDLIAVRQLSFQE